MLVREVKFESRLRGHGFKSWFQILVYGLALCVALCLRILFRYKKYKTGLVDKARHKNLHLIGIKCN